jgi:hypothetical protein
MSNDVLGCWRSNQAKLLLLLETTCFGIRYSALEACFCRENGCFEYR